jgi:hypothetical protein
MILGGAVSGQKEKALKEYSRLHVDAKQKMEPAEEKVQV